MSKLKKNNVEKYLRHFAETIIKRGKQILNAKGKAGKLRKGYKYSGKKLKSGLPQIVKAKSKKN